MIRIYLFFFMCFILAFPGSGQANLKFKVGIKKSKQLKFEVRTDQFTHFTVEWGDGVKERVRSEEMITHVYDSPFTGNLIISGLDGNLIRFIELTGGFQFNISSLFNIAPSIDTLIINEGSHIYGNIAQKPASLIYVDVQAGKLFGNFSKENLKNVQRLRLVKGTHVKLDISDFDDCINYIGLTGNNEVSGSIDGLDYRKLTHLDIKGENTITGDIGNMKSIPPIFVLSGRNSVSYQHQGQLKVTGKLQLFILDSSTRGLTSSEVDQLIIDIDKAGAIWKGAKKIILSGRNEPSTPLSESAVKRLKSRNVKVYTN